MQWQIFIFVKNYLAFMTSPFLYCTDPFFWAEICLLSQFPQANITLKSFKFGESQLCIPFKAWMFMNAGPN
jgi:hypothetical protein